MADDNAPVTPVPDYVRPGEGPLDAESLQAAITHLVKNAANHIDTNVAPERAKATELYRAQKLGNEQPGRSQIVVSTVRDAVRGIKPAIAKVVFGAERPLELHFSQPGTEEIEAQATDYLRQVVEVLNPGEKILDAALDDGLIRGLGVVKWWWEDGHTVAKKQVLAPEALEQLALDPAVTITAVAETDAGLEVEFTVRETEGCAKFEALPGNEFLYDAEAVSVDKALFVAHRTKKSRGELIKLGITPAFIEANAGPSSDLDENEEAIVRNPNLNSPGMDEDGGQANQKVDYVEAYPFLDKDGDGVAELLKVTCVGPNFAVFEAVPADTRPFAVWSPVTEAHMLQGQSIADLTGDMQRAETNVLRSTLDSLALSIFPRVIYKDGDVNVKDLLNQAIGAPIRAKSGPDAARSFSNPFVGKDALPLISLFHELVERRTGLDKGTQGLDADSLQSSTQQAVGAAVEGAKIQTEMIARAFIRDLLKPLYFGLYQLYLDHKPRLATTRLRGKWVEIDPSTWDARAVVRIVAPVGAGLVEQRLETLTAIKDDIDGILKLLGPVNPLTTVGKARHVRAEILKLRGFLTPDLFYNEVDDQAIAQAAQAAQDKPNDQSPEMALVQEQIKIEAMKAQHDAQIKEMELQAKAQQQQADLAFKQQELALKEREMMLRDDRERDKQAADIQLARERMQLEFQAKIDEANLRAAIEQERITTQAETQKETAKVNASAKAKAPAANG